MTATTVRDGVNSITTHREALRFIVDTIARQGFPPTVREIGKAVGYSSASSAAVIVSGLTRRGWIYTLPYRTRTMKVTPAGMKEADRG